MKRLILLICLIFVSATQAFAYCDYSTLCPAHIYPASSSAAQFFAQATGSNFVVEQFAQGIIENELRKATGQPFKAELKAISVNDLFNGKFKSLEITGNNINLQGVYLSSLKIKTMCDYNSIDIMAKPIKVRENLILKVSAEITATDLRNTVELGGYANKISQANLSKIGISSFRVYSPTIEIKNNKLYFTGNAIPSGPYKPMDIIVSADIKVNSGRIVTSRIEMLNLYSGFDLSSFSELLGSLHNLNYKVNLLGNEKSEIQIQNVNITGDKIILDGIVFIPRD